jgi:hypothetical protein
MAIIVLSDVQVLIGPSSGTVVDLSDHVSSVQLSTVHDLFETTVIGDVSKRQLAGLANNSVSFDFLQDFANNSVEDTIAPLVGGLAYCKIKPKGSLVTSVSNPRYEFEITISEWSSLNGGVGELSTARVTWPIYGDINKFTS